MNNRVDFISTVIRTATIMMESEEYSEYSDSSLELSCYSSPFEDSKGEDSSKTRIQPYQYEPYQSDIEEYNHDEGNGEEQNRSEDTTWCSCGHCQVMESNRECTCCNELERVKLVKDEFPDLQCITDHPAFSPVCLDAYVLRVAYTQYRQQYGERSEQNNE